jgi:hypothetical protein
LRRTSVAFLLAVLALCVCGGLAAAKKRHKKRGPFTGQTQPVSVQRTDKFGKYHVDLSHPAYGGNYQAKAPKVSKRGTQLCRAGQSSVLTVPTVPRVP